MNRQVSVNEREYDVIFRYLERAVDKTPDDEILQNKLYTLSALAYDLYNELFSYRGRLGVRILSEQAKHPLSECFKQLKYSRPIKAQDFLDECIKKCEESLEITTFLDKSVKVNTVNELIHESDDVWGDESDTVS